MDRVMNTLDEYDDYERGAFNVFTQHHITQIAFPTTLDGMWPTLPSFLALFFPGVSIYRAGIPTAKPPGLLTIFF